MFEGSFISQRSIEEGADYPFPDDSCILFYGQTRGGDDPTPIARVVRVEAGVATELCSFEGKAWAYRLVDVVAGVLEINQSAKPLGVKDKLSKAAPIVVEKKLDAYSNAELVLELQRRGYNIPGVPKI